MAEWWVMLVDHESREDQDAQRQGTEKKMKIPNPQHSEVHHLKFRLCRNSWIIRFPLLTPVHKTLRTPKLLRVMGHEMYWITDISNIDSPCLINIYELEHRDQRL